MYTAKLLLNPVISGSSSGINNHRNIGLFFFLSPGSSAKKGRSGPACDSAHIRSIPHVAPKLSQTSHTCNPSPHCPQPLLGSDHSYTGKDGRKRPCGPQGLPLHEAVGSPPQGQHPYPEAGPGA